MVQLLADDRDGCGIETRSSERLRPGGGEPPALDQAAHDGRVVAASRAGGGGSALPLSGRARVEVLLTAATTLMAVAALASLRPEEIDGWIVAAAFAVQTLLPSLEMPLFVALALLVFALDIPVSQRQALRPIAAALPLRLRPPAGSRPRP